MSATNLDLLLATILREGISSVPLTLEQFFEQRIIIPDGPFKGLPYSFHRQPVNRLWCRAIDSGLWTEFVYSGPSQMGKTLHGYVGPLLWHACELGESLVMGVPFVDMADNKYKADLKPTLEASTHLSRLLPRSGPGSAGGKVADAIQLTNGSLIKICSAGGDDAGKAGFTARVVTVTEAAKFSQANQASVEADPLRQLRARQRSYQTHERRTYVEGTMTVDTELPWALRSQSTRSRIVSPCPHCGEFVSPDQSCLVGWSSALSEKQAANEAYWTCDRCGEKITEKERASMLADAVLLHDGQAISKRGKITGDPPETLRLWFHPQAFHNLLLSAGDVAQDCWKAEQIPEDSNERISADKELDQFVFSCPYTPPRWTDEIDLDRKSIDRRREYRRTVAPPESDVIGVGIDIGMRRLWYLVSAGLPDGSEHWIDYDCVDVDLGKPTQVAIMESLDQLRLQFDAGFGCGEKTITPDQVWADASSKYGRASREFTARLNGLNLYATWLAVYGRGETQMDAMAKNYTQPKKTGSETREIGQSYHINKMPKDSGDGQRQPLPASYAGFWDADATKLSIHQALTLESGKPGSITLYAGVPKIHERLTRHLTNERRVLEKTPRGERLIWKRFGEQHLFDCAAMARRAIARARVLKAKRTNDQSRSQNDSSASTGKGWY